MCQSINPCFCPPYRNATKVLWKKIHWHLEQYLCFCYSRFSTTEPALGFSVISWFRAVVKRCRELSSQRWRRSKGLVLHQVDWQSRACKEGVQIWRTAAISEGRTRRFSSSQTAQLLFTPLPGHCPVQRTGWGRAQWEALKNTTYWSCSQAGSQAGQWPLCQSLTHRRSFLPHTPRLLHSGESSAVENMLFCQNPSPLTRAEQEPALQVAAHFAHVCSQPCSVTEPRSSREYSSPLIFPLWLCLCAPGCKHVFSSLVPRPCSWGGLRVLSFLEAQCLQFSLSQAAISSSHPCWIWVTLELQIDFLWITFWSNVLVLWII